MTNPTLGRGWFAVSGATAHFPTAANGGTATYSASVFNGKKLVYLTSLQVISDPNVSAAAMTILVVDKAGATKLTWGLAKNAAVPRELIPPGGLLIEEGFGINAGAADVTVLATYSIYS